MEKQISIGNLIFHELKEQERSIAWLAQKVYCSHHTMCDILKRDYLDTDLLLRISKSLKYDFFTHYSAFLKERCLLIDIETNIVEKEKIVIGNLIHKKLEEQERSVAWLALKVRRKYSALSKILKRDYIDTTLLFHISDVLKYDFFAHYSASLKKML